MRVIYRKIRHARYLYIKRNVETVWGARYTLGARYLSKNTVVCRADLKRSINGICCFLLVAYILVFRLPNIAICADYIFNTDLRRDHRPRWGDNRE